MITFDEHAQLLRKCFLHSKGSCAGILIVVIHGGSFNPLPSPGGEKPPAGDEISGRAQCAPGPGSKATELLPKRKDSCHSRQLWTPQQRWPLPQAEQMRASGRGSCAGLRDTAASRSLSRETACTSVCSIFTSGGLAAWCLMDSHFLPIPPTAKRTQKMCAITNPPLSLHPGQRFSAQAVWLVALLPVPQAPSLHPPPSGGPLPTIFVARRRWTLLSCDGLPFFLVLSPVCLCSITAVTPTVRSCSTGPTSCYAPSGTSRPERR